jgi:chromosomal replication initiator protein
MNAAQPCIPGFEPHMRSAKLTVAEIQREVADWFGLPVEEMTSARRFRAVARPRQVAMFLSKELTPKSLPDIGQRFGGRDHTTVIHAIKQVEKLCSVDAEVEQDVEGCRRRILGLVGR